MGRSRQPSGRTGSRQYLRQPICRLHFNNPDNKYLALIDEDKKHRLVSIESIDDIFQYADEIRAAANRYLPADQKFIAEPAEA